MLGRRREPKQPPSIFSLSVLVGAVGLSLASSSPGGLNATSGFFLAFALAFLLGGGALLLVRNRRADSAYHTRPPGQDPQGVPRDPRSPMDQGADIEHGSAERSRDARYRYDS